MSKKRESRKKKTEVTNHISSESRLARWKKGAQDNRFIASLCLFAIIVLGLGGLAGAITSLQSLWSSLRAPTDHRSFRFQDQSIRFAGGNGLSQDQAIIIVGAVSSDAGLAAEYHWLQRFYLDHSYVRRSHTIGKDSGKLRHFDVFELRTPGGFPRFLFFDITGFFGTPARDPVLRKLVEQWADREMPKVFEKIRQESEHPRRQ